MPLLRTQLYYLAIALLLTHEMDAVMEAEWRLLFGLRGLSDAVAYPLFLLLHVPVVVLLFWLAHHPRDALREGFRSASAGFLIVHAGIHLHVSGAPDYGFESFVSQLLIFGAALVGLAYVALSVLDRNEDTHRG